MEVTHGIANRVCTTPAAAHTASPRPRRDRDEHRDHDRTVAARDTLAAHTGAPTPTPRTAATTPSAKATAGTTSRAHRPRAAT